MTLLAEFALILFCINAPIDQRQALMTLKCNTANAKPGSELKLTLCVKNVSNSSILINGDELPSNNGTELSCRFCKVIVSYLSNGKLVVLKEFKLKYVHKLDSKSETYLVPDYDHYINTDDSSFSVEMPSGLEKITIKCHVDQLFKGTSRVQSNTILIMSDVK